MQKRKITKVPKAKETRRGVGEQPAVTRRPALKEAKNASVQRDTRKEKAKAGVLQLIQAGDESNPAFRPNFYLKAIALSLLWWVFEKE